MSDPFSDYNLMTENIGKVDRGEVRAVRVSAEHYLWLCSARSTISAITQTAGGEVEGHPTSVVNILQRIRRLVEIEVALSEAREELCSALEIAQRQGLRTNWAAFESSLRKMLSDIRLVLSVTSQELGAPK